MATKSATVEPMAISDAPAKIDLGPKPSILTAKPHRYADLMPQASDDDFKTLSEDIERQGRVHDAIVLFEGQILDGRHRREVIDNLWDRGIKVEYKVEEYDEVVSGPAIDFVYSKGMARRNITMEQKALSGLGFMDELQKVAKRGGKKGQGSLGGDARDIAAKKVGVSGKVLDIAKKVRDVAPDVFERMKAGQVTVWGAKKEIERRAEEEKHKSDEAAGVFAKAPEFDWYVDHVAVLYDKSGEKPDDKPVNVVFREQRQADGTVAYEGVAEVEGNPTDNQVINARTVGAAQRQAIEFYHMVNTPPAPDVVPAGDSDGPDADGNSPLPFGDNSDMPDNSDTAESAEEMMARAQEEALLENERIRAERAEQERIDSEAGDSVTGNITGSEHVGM